MQYNVNARPKCLLYGPKLIVVININVTLEHQQNCNKVQVLYTTTTNLSAENSLALITPTVAKIIHHLSGQT